ncbi:hypothetical protein DSM112329_03048 [Paraconexibacter sp. AEG42_29]|uniref:DUF3866 family protein n=1 Tax=Paraconexibacter sp. AEG42_29 TaxID=2997339 RepID=A0AAU7AWT8_9ACTN
MAPLRLVLRRGTVTAADPAPATGEQRLVVTIDGAERQAIADVAYVGPAEVGDDVVVNGQAVDLRLGSGGFDVVHVNLTRGLGSSGVDGAHVMKLNYSPLQHAVLPIERELLDLPTDADWTTYAPLAPEHPPSPQPAVGVFGLHGQLAPIAWAVAANAATPLRVGYVQTAGGALPGGHSRVVTDLLDRGLLVGHLAASPAYGGRDGEAITTIGAIDHALTVLGWDIALCGPGPGILGSGSRLGHGGMIALDTAHAALALGYPTTLCARMSAGDPRPRHRGLSHHTQTVVELLLQPVQIALPTGTTPPEDHGFHAWSAHTADLDGYVASGLPARTMGRSSAEDPVFFEAALACGMQLAAGPPPDDEDDAHDDGDGLP